jgi:hypothetical protein
MDERQFIQRRKKFAGQAHLSSCRGKFQHRWKICRKKELRAGSARKTSENCKASSYMVRLDDLVACYKNAGRFELTGQSTVLINDLGDPNADPENFGNR